MDNLVITEGVEGYWHYHLSHAEKTSKSLCGKTTMQTDMSMEQWGSVGELRERYCGECMLISKLRGKE